MKRNIIALFLLISFLFSGCSEKHHSFLTRDDVSSIVFDSELKHTQYWNKHDAWDFTGVDAYFLFENYDTYCLEITDLSFSYDVFPLSPVGLELSENKADKTLVSLTNIKYTNANGLVYEIEDVDYEVTIVEYPYSEEKVSFNKHAPLFIIIFCSGVIIAVIIIIAYNRKTRTKK